jgi:hypothetical protein
MAELAELDLLGHGGTNRVRCKVVPVFASSYKRGPCRLYDHV